MFLRSPVTGISGGHPTRLQVAWSVESWRKLASSVKISAQCRERAFFFKRLIDAAVPAILRRSVGPSQHAAGPLHRKSPVMKQLAHVPRMILNAEFLLDQPGDHGPCANAAVQPVSDRAAVQDISQLLLLFLGEFRWTA